MNFTFEERLKRSGIQYIGLDDEFVFSCVRCGECCMARGDIELDCLDVFRLAESFGITTEQMVERIGAAPSARQEAVPRLFLRQEKGECPFLVNNECSVNGVKPSLCAMAPIGKAVEMGKDENGCFIYPSEQSFLLAPYACGDEHGEVYTVRQWLEQCNIEPFDDLFISWHFLLASASVMLQGLLGNGHLAHYLRLRMAVYRLFYLEYDTAKPFGPQFAANKALLEEVFSNVQKTLKYPRQERVKRLDTLLRILAEN